MPERDGIPARHPGWRVWFGLLAAPLAWSVDELLSLFVHEGTCAMGALTPGRPAPTPILALIGVLMAAVACAGLLTAWRTHRAAGRPGGTGPEVSDQRPFLAMFGTIVSAIFLFGIVLRFITVFFIAPCHFT